MQKIKAIIFDMDGLLIDSEPVWNTARERMAKEAGVIWTGEDHQAVMGVSTDYWVNYMIKRLNLHLEPDLVEEYIVNSMVELYNKGVPFFPGAVTAVQLAGEKFPLGLASGSPLRLIETVLADPSMAGWFKTVCSSDQVQRGKPAPDVYLAAAKELGVEPDRCVCLEDSGNGILAGKNAGMKVIGVPDPRFPADEDKLEKADILLQSLKEFSLDTIKRLEE